MGRKRHSGPRDDVGQYARWYIELARRHSIRIPIEVAAMYADVLVASFTTSTYTRIEALYDADSTVSGDAMQVDGSSLAGQQHSQLLNGDITLLRRLSRSALSARRGH